MIKDNQAHLKEQVLLAGWIVCPGFSWQVADCFKSGSSRLWFCQVFKMNCDVEQVHSLASKSNQIVAFAGTKFPNSHCTFSQSNCRSSDDAYQSSARISIGSPGFNFESGVYSRDLKFQCHLIKGIPRKQRYITKDDTKSVDEIAALWLSSNWKTLAFVPMTWLGCDESNWRSHSRSPVFASATIKRMQ